ncbi:hypothetical protein GQ44DRAFT_773528 [Phaeosphaeriaceae sp. PMI808]|nr:hypothetical protein GQ44DRAFT_773528 [Phaeosphaeriaceae sp. PMI808]
MPEYAKMKNADLETLLKERGLPTGGKKADMVDRLVKDDTKSAAPAESKAAVNAEDEIDWDDEGDETAAPAAKIDNPVTTAEKTSAVVGGEDKVAETDAAQTVDPVVAPAAEDAGDAKPEETKEPVPDYTIGLAATKLEEEIEKRKKRAEKFGLKIEDDEGLKKLERSKKFGESGPPRGLDEALPERNRKRGREGGDEAGDHKRRGGGRVGGRGRERRDNRDGRDNRNSRDSRDNRNKGDRDNRKEQGRSNAGGNWMSDKDKVAADARKAKWAKPAAS